MKGEDAVEFRVDGGLISNGDSYKGYEYTTAPVSSVRTNLDGYRISDIDRDRLGGWIVRAPIRGNWYLYLFVNP